MSIGALLNDVQHHYGMNFPMLRILEGDFSGLIDLWERGPDRKTFCQSQSRLAVG
jgi:hypothetical protein